MRCSFGTLRVPRRFVSGLATAFFLFEFALSTNLLAGYIDDESVSSFFNFCEKKSPAQRAGPSQIAATADKTGPSGAAYL
jgi:hypothetical protein